MRYRLKASSGGHGGSDSEIVKAFNGFAGDGITPNTSPLAARNAVAAGILGHESMRNGSIPKVVPPVPAHMAEYFKN